MTEQDRQQRLRAKEQAHRRAQAQAGGSPQDTVTTTEHTFDWRRSLGPRNPRTGERADWIDGVYEPADIPSEISGAERNALFGIVPIADPGPKPEDVFRRAEEQAREDGLKARIAKLKERVR